jgi:hypothetical protein
LGTFPESRRQDGVRTPGVEVDEDNYRLGGRAGGTLT